MTHRRGRRASQPQPGFTTRTTAPTDTALTCTVTLEEIGEYTIDLSDWPCPVQLKADLLQAMYSLVMTEGRWAREKTVKLNLDWVKHFATWIGRWDSPSMSGIAQPQAVQDITPAMWDAYVLEHQTGRRGGVARNIQVALVLRATGCLTDEALARVSARKVIPEPEGELGYYTKQEFDGLVATAKRVVRAAHERITPNYAEALASADHTGAPTRGSVLHEMLTTMPARPYPIAKARLIGAIGRHVSQGRVRDYPLYSQAREMLFPNADEGFAMAVLLSSLLGLNWSQVESMDVPSRDLDSAGRVAQSSTDKPRRGPRRRFSVEVLVDAGDDSNGAWIRRIEEITNPLRDFLANQGTPTDRLFLFVDRESKPKRQVAMNRKERVPVEQRLGFPEIDFRRLKRTFETAIAKEATQNTEATHLLDYVLKNPDRIAEYRDAAASGIERAYNHAMDTVALTFVGEDSTEARQAQHDSVMAGCKDPEHEPTTGKPCEDGFFGCLSCPNAVATNRHLPLMRYVLTVLEELRAVLPGHVWETRWQWPYAQLALVLDSAPSAPNRRVTKEQQRLVRLALGATGEAQ